MEQHDVSIRDYDAAQDADAVVRIWREVRWIDDSDPQAAAVRRFVADGATEVGLIDGSPECAVVRARGTIDLHQEPPVPLCAIAAVTTSHVGRKRGLASRLTARAVQFGAADGAAVAALGMFEQGFYDRFGFGTGAYGREVVFDPTALRVDHVRYRAPTRLTADNADEMYRALLARQPRHGVIRLHGPEQFAAEFAFMERPIALGYRDGGALTHFLAGTIDDENGPLRVRYLAYRSSLDLLELLRLLHELGDQIHAVKMAEPPGIQLQALLDQPMRHLSRTRNASNANQMHVIAWWQARILDLEACAPSVRWCGSSVDFRLELHDPIDRYAGEEVDWRGLTGHYAVRVGDPSTIVPGDGALPPDAPTMRCSVNALTRLWLGVSAASSLAITDSLDAPPDLLARLDRAIPLADPQPGVYF